MSAEIIRLAAYRKPPPPPVDRAELLAEMFLMLRNLDAETLLRMTAELRKAAK